MKKLLLWLFLPLMALTYAACGSDDDSDSTGDGGQTVKSDTVVNNNNMLIVTGGLTSAVLGYEENEYWDSRYANYYDDRLTVSLYSYANLTEELKPLLGLGLDLGIEIGSDANLSDARRYYASSIDADNRFSVTGWAPTGKKLYWRAFLGVDDFKEYGEVRSLDMPTQQAAMKAMKVECGEVRSVEESCAYITFALENSFWNRAGQAGLAYATDPSLLTPDNLSTALRHAQDDGLWTTGPKSYAYYFTNFESHQADSGIILEREKQQETVMPLWNLASGTTYYYCEYCYAKGSTTPYVVMSDVKEFKTEGENTEELTRKLNIQVNHDDNAKKWNVRISSQLENDYPGSVIRYGVITSISSTYTPYSYDGNTTVTVYYQDGGETYASKHGSYFEATANYPSYMATLVGDELVDPWISEKLGYGLGALYAFEEVVSNLMNKVNSGEGDDCDRAELNALLNLVRYDANIYDKLLNTLSVFVEIDNTRYIVKEEKIKLQ